MTFDSVGFDEPGRDDGGIPVVSKNAILTAEMDKIRSKHQHVTPALVVDHARDEDSPLHPYFQWDDDLAGEQYRLMQARQIIRAVIIRTPDTTRTLPAWVHTRDEDGPKYVHIEDISVSQYEIGLQHLAGKLDIAARAVEDLLTEFGEGRPQPKKILWHITRARALLAQMIPPTAHH